MDFQMNSHEGCGVVLSKSLKKNKSPAKYPFLDMADQPNDVTIPIEETNETSFVTPPSRKNLNFNLLMNMEPEMLQADTAELILAQFEDANSIPASGKRNRQISTDSSSSIPCEMKKDIKVNKKSKKKIRKNQEVDDEIQKILMDLNTDTKACIVKETKPYKLCQEQVDGLSDTAAPNIGIGCVKQAKKKKKKRVVNNTIELSDVGDENSVLSQIQNCDTKDCSQLQSDKKIVEKDHVSLVNSVLANADKKDRKKPGKKQIAAMHAAIQKAKEEEEKIMRDELAKQRLAEERERLTQEKLRLEKEKKEMKKQKERDRKERLRAEGKFLTKTQKAAKARMQNVLSAWREHGIDVPFVGVKKASETKLSQKKRSKDDPSESKTALNISHTKDSYMVSSKLLDAEDTFNNEAEKDSKCYIRHRHLTDSELQCSVPHENNFDAVHASSSELALRMAKIEVNNDRLRTKSESDIVNSRTKFKEKLVDSCRLRMEVEEEINCPYRSPVICVLGHVDTGKTKILDKIRKTHVQDNEAGGITQQIGATMVPREALKEKCSMANVFAEFELELPGLLIIDTPGHESFRNLRTRGSSLCDLAILVVDIMHGIEKQTEESIELLKKKKTPFVVALNKVDRLYGWKSDPFSDVQDVINLQEIGTRSEFEKKYKQVIADFNIQGLNASLFYDNPDPRSYVSMVPVSAMTGDGMGNLLALVCKFCQSMMSKRLTFSNDLEATVLEVKTTAGLGTTIDVILVNGQLKEGNTIILAGHDSPVVTQIRSILMPQPLKELRVKNAYQEFKSIKGAQGIKISGKDLDKAIAGLPLYVAHSPEEIPELKERMSVLFRNTMNSIKVSERGVYVQASTLGSLEALLEFLKTSDVPYAGVKVGPVVKKDVIKASVMLEHDVQYAVILAFDVKVERDAQELSDHLGIKIFQADIIYHLFDNFTEYRQQLADKKKIHLKQFAVFPCKLRVLPDFVFNIKDPIILGVHVEAGMLKTGTPISVPSRNFMNLGTVSTLEVDHKFVDCAKEGDDVCVKIEAGDEAIKACYGKHFDDEDILVSKISRQTIDVCKEFYRNDLQKSDWKLIVELKKLFSIV